MFSHSSHSAHLSLSSSSSSSPLILIPQILGFANANQTVENKTSGGNASNRGANVVMRKGYLAVHGMGLRSKEFWFVLTGWANDV